MECNNSSVTVATLLKQSALACAGEAIAAMLVSVLVKAHLLPQIECILQLLLLLGSNSDKKVAVISSMKYILCPTHSLVACTCVLCNHRDFLGSSSNTPAIKEKHCAQCYSKPVDAEGDEDDDDDDGGDGGFGEGEELSSEEGGGSAGNNPPSNNKSNSKKGPEGAGGAEENGEEDDDDEEEDGDDQEEDDDDDEDDEDDDDGGDEEEEEVIEEEEEEEDEDEEEESLQPPKKRKK